MVVESLVPSIQPIAIFIRGYHCPSLCAGGLVPIYPLNTFESRHLIQFFLPAQVIADVLIVDLSALLGRGILN